MLYECHILRDWHKQLLSSLCVIITLHFCLEQSQGTCRYIIHIIMHQDGCCSRMFLFGFLFPSPFLSDEAGAYGVFQSC